jgi:hypothetical protein
MSRVDYHITAQIYARIYDETLYEQFKTAMSRLEAIAVMIDRGLMSANQH